MLKGVPFHGEFSSADASSLTEANSRFALYGGSSAASLTLKSTDQVIVTDVFVSSVAAVTVSIYDGANATVDAGELMHKGIHQANTMIERDIITPHYAQVGTYPKLKASGAGQVDALINGYIVSTGET